MSWICAYLYAVGFVAIMGGFAAAHHDIDGRDYLAAVCWPLYVPIAIIRAALACAFE